jgi:hypothetical protein
MNYCNDCGRTDEDPKNGVACVVRTMEPARPSIGIMQPWKFEYFLCRWHRAVQKKRGWSWRPLRPDEWTREPQTSPT